MQFVGSVLGVLLVMVAVPIGLVQLFDLLGETGDLPTTVVLVFNQLPLLWLIATISSAGLGIIGIGVATFRHA